ncbi:MAG: PLP-dependent aminotransferase family protein [Chloroflexi bacterium]|nr:PLP-dependent aminotransferase family protein [Chloroflexota bacterium]
MTGNALDYSTLFNKDLPAPAAQFEGHPKYNFIGGHSDPDSVPMEGFIEAATNVFSGDPKYMSMYSLDGPQGILLLRQFVVDKLRAHRGIEITTDEVLITSGSGQGIQIINDVLLEEGDTVIVEEFSFSGALNFLRKRNVNFVGVKIDDDGIVMEDLERILKELRGKGIRPKYIYTIPTLQNPNGSVMSMERRHRMLELSAEYGVPIFEDECYADLVFEDEYEPAIKALDDTNRVLHIGSFSKNLGPAMRLGYMVAPWEIISRFISAKADAGSGVMDQLIVGDYFTNHYDEHIQDLRAALQRKRDALGGALRESFGPNVEFEMPRGGMYLWMKFPDGVDVRELVAPALEEGIAFNPGPDWSADPEAAANYIRLCFALPSVEDIWEGVAKLADVFRREGALP